MPMDVLYTIFSYLPPKSLLALAKVNRIFHKGLTSPGIMFIWARIRKACKAPDPFPGALSELDWVRLLFGSNHCKECGNKGVQNINFILHKRICFACVKRAGVSKGRFNHSYPGVDKGVLDLILPTDGGHKTGHTQYYNRDEINRVLSSLNACQNPEELEQYKEERRKYLERLKVHAQVCSRWVYDDQERHAEDAENVRAAHFEAISSRLVALGYTDKDILGVKNISCVYKDQLLTNHGWAKIKNEVLETVLYYRVIRLLDEQTEIVTSRCGLIAQGYTNYKKSLKPEEWHLLPCIETVWLFPSMAAVLGLPDSVNVTEDDLAGPLSSLPEDLRTEMDKILGAIAYGYRIANAVAWACQPYSPTGPTGFSDFVESFAGHRLWDGPATVQARCFTCDSVCTSVHTLARHLTGPCKLQNARAGGSVPGLRVGFDVFFSRSSACLVWATGLDIAKATVHDMDDRGAFYQCLKCPTPFIGTWRECILHAFERLPTQYCSHENIFDQGLDDPIFKVLDDEPSDSRICWTCNHCAAHVEELETRESVVAHLRDQHGITEPHVPKDFFYIDRVSHNDL
ncbi:hypothetical protein E1B28_005322 [Marasmius oreades]|nr:uncharacterized protein E1B28_005322 [Marasmius oreades]KAG7098014.1 hypothetical protein E1B28_005322 [Marasmius oreades]